MAWKWSTRREKAAKLAADDALTNEQIAASVGVTRQAVDYWRAAPEFQARVAEIVAAYAEAIKGEGIANVKNRVAAQNDRWQRMQRIIDQRALDPSLADIPGGDTGLIVRTAKLVKVYGSIPSSGDEAESLQSAKREVLVYEYAADTGLAAEMRATEKEAAEQLGQRVAKQEVTGKGGKPISIASAAFDWAEYQRLYGDLAGIPTPGGDAAPDDGAGESVDTAES